MIGILLVGGCGNSDKVKLLEEENKRLKAEANVKLLEEKLEKAEEATPTAKPVKELTLREKVVGAYGAKVGEDTIKIVLLENGIIESHQNGNRLDDTKWSISEEGEIRFYESGRRRGDIQVWRINTDKSITEVAFIRNGKRTDEPRQLTLKKIK